MDLRNVWKLEQPSKKHSELAEEHSLFLKIHFKQCEEVVKTQKWINHDFKKCFHRIMWRNMIEFNISIVTVFSFMTIFINLSTSTCMKLLLICYRNILYFLIWSPLISLWQHTVNHLPIFFQFALHSSNGLNDAPYRVKKKDDQCRGANKANMIFPFPPVWCVKSRDYSCHTTNNYHLSTNNMMQSSWALQMGEKMSMSNEKWAQ